MVKPFVISLAVGLLSGTNAAYPATYPFENESTGIVYPPAAAPSGVADGVVDDADPGGYFHTYIVERTEIEAGIGWVRSGMCDYMLTVAWKMTLPLPTGMLNCTARGDNIFGEPTYKFDSVGGTQYCDSKEECCSDLHGLYKYRREGHEAMETDVVTYETYAENGICTEMFHQGMFCQLFNDYLSYFCDEMVMSDTERYMPHEMITCFDNGIQWYLNCPIYKNVIEMEIELEPVAYMEGMTTEEYKSWFFLRLMPDKVCHPYSYFFPETAKVAESAGDDDDEDETKKTASAASESDSAAAFIVASFAGLAMML